MSYNAKWSLLVGPSDHARSYTLFDRLIYIARRMCMRKDLTIYLALIKLSNADAICSATIDTIAEHASCTDRTVYSALTRLEALGFIERHKAGGPPEIHLLPFDPGPDPDPDLK